MAPAGRSAWRHPWGISGAARLPPAAPPAPESRLGRDSENVQWNHIHFIVEAADQIALGRAIKGLLVRMARALNKVMDRKGQVFADRYHAHLLRSPREAANAVRYVLDNWRMHALRDGRPAPTGIDPYCSTAWAGDSPPLVAEAWWWMLRVGVYRSRARAQAAA